MASIPTTATLRIENVEFSKLDDKNIVSEVIETQTKRKAKQTIDLDPKIKEGHETYRPVLINTKKEVVLTKPGCKHQKITVKETTESDNETANGTRKEDIRIEELKYWDPAKNEHGINSEVPQGPYTLRPEPKRPDEPQNYDKFDDSKIISADSSTINPDGRDGKKSSSDKKRSRKNQADTSNIDNNRKNKENVANQEIKLKKDEVNCKKPVSKLPKKISTKSVQRKDKDNNAEIGATKPTFGEAQIVLINNNKDGRQRIYCVAPEGPHFKRDDPEYGNKDKDVPIKKDNRMEEKKEKKEKRTAVTQIIDPKVSDGSSISSDVPKSPHNIRDRSMFFVEKETIDIRDSKKNIEEKWIPNEATDKVSDECSVSNANGVDNNEDTFSHDSVNKSLPINDDGTTILLDDIVNTEIPDEIDEIFDELYDSLGDIVQDKKDAEKNDIQESNNATQINEATLKNKLLGSKEPEGLIIRTEVKKQIKTNHDSKDTNTKEDLSRSDQALKTEDKSKDETFNKEVRRDKTLGTCDSSLDVSQTSDKIPSKFVDNKKFTDGRKEEIKKDLNLKEHNIQISKRISNNTPSQRGNKQKLEGETTSTKANDNKQINAVLQPTSNNYKHSNELSDDVKEGENKMDNEVSHNSSTPIFDGSVSPLKDEDNIDSSVLKPVFTVTKEEIIRTSPTSRLQKIIVTEKKEDVVNPKINVIEMKNFKDEKPTAELLTREPDTRTASKQKMKEIVDRSSDDYNQIEKPKHGSRTPKEVKVKSPKIKPNLKNPEINLGEIVSVAQKPKIVDELTKKHVGGNESRIPKRQSSLDITKEATYKNNDMHNSKEIIKKENSERMADKISLVENDNKKLLKRLDSLPTKSESFPKSEETIKTEKVKLDTCDLDVANAQQKMDGDNCENVEKKNKLPKQSINVKVKNMLKNIVPKNKSNDDDLKKINTESVELQVSVNKEIVHLPEDKYDEDFSKISDIRGKVKRVLQRFENTTDNIAITKNQQMSNQKIINQNNVMLADEKPAIRTVETILRKFESQNDKINHPDSKITVDKKYNSKLLNSKPFVGSTVEIQVDDSKHDLALPDDKYLRRVKTEEELAKEVSKGKVKNILRKIEAKNNSFGEVKAMSKGKSMENLASRDFRREFARRKSVSATIAMFENNSLSSAAFDARSRKDTGKTISDNLSQSTKIAEMNGNKANGNDKRNGKHFHENELNGNGPERNGNDDKETRNNGNHSVEETNGNCQLDKDEAGFRARLDELRHARDKFGTMETMPTLELNNGYKMPVIAVGTALLEPRAAVAVVRAALQLGYRHVDSAPIYGNERDVGRALRDAIDDGDVTREEVFVTSKLWNTFHRRDLVEAACRDTLDKLGLDYLDLLLVHSPISFKEEAGLLPIEGGALQYSETSDYMDAWHGMEELVRKGLVRSIGVSNFNSEQLERVLAEGSIAPVVNQVESHPYLTQRRLEEFCLRRGVALLCYGALGSPGTPPAHRHVGRDVLHDTLVRELAVRHARTPAQILIRYQLQRGRGAVVKASSAARLWDNLQAVTFTLTRDELAALDALDIGQRHFVFKGMGETHKNYPFKIPF